MLCTQCFHSLTRISINIATASAPPCTLLCLDLDLVECPEALLVLREGAVEGGHLPVLTHPQLVHSGLDKELVVGDLRDGGGAVCRGRVVGDLWGEGGYSCVGAGGGAGWTAAGSGRHGSHETNRVASDNTL